VLGKQFVYLSAYLNALAIVSHNDDFSTFFSTRSKNVFVYPDFNLSFYLNPTATNGQSIKLDLDLVVNNGDASYLYPSKSGLIPSLSITFLSNL
jgi:hypothetical protein